MTIEETTIPDQKELEKEIGDYLSRKYGDRITIVSTGLHPAAKADKDGKGEHSSNGKSLPFRFDLKPQDLIAYLDEYIIKQDRAKAVLATKICTHFNRIRFVKDHGLSENALAGRIKNNILLIGPTGVGKTFLIKLIAARLGVPFVKGDATKFSETGYVGGDVEDLIRDLVREADGDIERAQYGIIYVDEIDKIAGSVGRQGLDVSRAGVQRALLKPMEETEVDLKVPHDMISQIEAMEHYRSTGKREKRVVNTKNILFIMSGAFDGLAEIVGKRLHHQTIGFEGSVLSQAQVANQLVAVKAEDLVQFGFEREFIGRLPVCAVLEDLTGADLQEILLSPNCALINAKKLDFLVYGIRLAFDPDIFGRIADKALSEKTGARGLAGVVENLLLPFEKTLPSTDIKYLVIDEAVLLNPEAELKLLLEDPEASRHHQERYVMLNEAESLRLVAFLKEKKAAGLVQRGLVLTPERLRLMADKIVEEPGDADTVCDLFVSLVGHIREWQKIIGEHCQTTITFDEAAIDYMLSRSPQANETIDGQCQPLMRFLEYGLRLIRQKLQITELVIPVEGIVDPEKYINQLVEKTYRV